MNPFEVKDCALLVRMSGLPPAFNLRELRERIAVCGENVLFHHFCETTLRGAFDNPDYRNDFSVWSKWYLGDRVVSERLGILDPYAFPSLGELRAATLEVIDERLGELSMISWARPGDELFFMEATTVVFDTGIRISDPRELAASIEAMTAGSVYFHFLEARRRLSLGKDDFSAWLIENGDGEKNLPYIEALGRIDFYFHTLSDLRKELVKVLSDLEGAT
ncbi:MAG: hypothetical protein AUK27_01995 [Deltaproteobacteria bacterium CG2_30_66_27]|nr:MAG: hypothetical protein AUK27_01995 [Deltaproteobacteria bacterium CG2_30_66_27]PJB32082.1 MAG: hypothetical protein CO109_06495 [Deltaproteobacteria bacterium CG_4_9_14_3_um_filter_65_9]